MILPHRFRRRLTIAFVFVAAVSTGMLALGTYILVSQHRLHTSVERATEITRLNVAIAPAELDADRITRILAYYARWSGVETVIELDGAVHQSRSDIGIGDVPPALRRPFDPDKVDHRRTTLRKADYLVTASQLPSSGARLYFFFSLNELLDSLEVLRNVLVGGCVFLTAFAALVGRAVARRTLAPVHSASQAARALAEGLLDTRLAVSGDDEFGAWAQYFNDMAQALQEKISALTAAHDRERRFTSDVAHELRTPLSSLVGASALLREHVGALPADARRPAQLVIGGVARLRKLVEDLMEVSRLDSSADGAMVVDRIDLADAISAMVRANGWSSSVETSLQPVIVDADRRSVDRVVGNLVSNALTHGGAHVRVRVYSAGQDAVVEVADDGPGISADQLPHIFERFHKVDSARSGGGSGLGLAIAQEHAHRLGGRVEVESELGKGSCFAFLLPRSHADGAEDAALDSAGNGLRTGPDGRVQAAG